MTSNRPYHLFFTLQQRATLSIAILVWNNQKVKDKITKWSHNLQKSVLEKAEDEWQQLTKEVLKEINPNVLPSLLIGELIHVVKALGEKIYNWCLYIQQEYYDLFGKKCDIINYIDKIYWTPIGTIDEVKILQLFWMKKPTLNIAVVYNIACQNALEEDINYLWQRIPREIKDRYKELYIYKDNKRPLGYFNSCYLNYAYWRHRTDGQIDHFLKFLESNDLSKNDTVRVVFNLTDSVDHKMFVLSVRQGYINAAKYFWKKLTQDEKNSSLLRSSYMIQKIYNFEKLFDDICGYTTEKYVEILIFLINQMTMEQEEAFFGVEQALEEISDGIDRKRYVKVDIFSMILSIWPWQKLFIPSLNNMMQYLEYNPKSILMILSNISRKMLKPSYDAKNSKYRSMFRQAWFIIPGSIKRTMIQSCSICQQHSNFIVHLLKVQDLHNVKTIFNDPEIADVRMQYIKLGQRGYESLIISNKYDILEQFMKEVLRSEQERIYLKSIIDHIYVCRQFIKTENYYSADKFLNWQFETEERKKQFKNDFYWKIFLMEWSRDIFKRNNGSVDKAKKETSRFLKWMFESEEDMVSFKKELLFKSELVIRNEFLRGPIQMTKPQAYQLRQILKESFL